jgi:SNF2 family DNA or RNA helicase
MAKQIPPPFEHQTAITNFIASRPATFVTSDPGTGKTRAVIDACYILGATTLVLAPLSILQSSWGDDIEQFRPDMTYAVAYNKNRAKAFDMDVDMVITNHDAVKWIVKNPHVLDRFDTIIIDESTAFKNKDSQRSKALAKMMQAFERRVAMTGTPIPNSVLDAWHQVFLLDNGEHLGKRFFTYRAAMCEPRFNGYANEWVDKKNAPEMLASAIFDINIRYRLEDCIDMPENIMSMVYTTLPDKVMKQYKQLAQESVVSIDGKEITSVHAGAKVRKLLQLCTGAAYDAEGNVVGIHEHRYELVLDLVQQRKHSLVAFNWKHERDYLVENAKKRGIKYAVIDGDAKVEDRTKIVKQYQEGELDVIFAHPQSAGHGLTLTKGTATIWCSPTYNAEHFTQFNRRIYRAGQTERTETICIAAKGTWETQVYNALQNKIARSEDLLNLLNETTKESA